MMQAFPTYEKKNEIVEPSFQVVENNTETVMVVVSVKEGEPDEPSFYFDGEEGLFLRKRTQAIRLVNVPAVGRDALNAAKIALIVETDDGSISLDEEKHIESEVHFSYEIPIQRVHSTSKRVSPSPLVSGVEHVLRVCMWGLMFFLMGLGVQVFYGGDRSLDVTSTNEQARRLIKEKVVRYLPKRVFYGRIFWTYIVKPERGVFYYPSRVKGKIRVFKSDYAANMKFRPVYRFGFGSGRLVLLVVLCIASIGMSFTSYNVYDMLKNAFVGAVEENVEDSLGG
jgi:hypothetical protein